MTTPVIILGCGPAGLFAAQAIKELGGQPLIHSAKQKSEIYGPQFLTQPIPGLTDEQPEAQVWSMRIGSRERYAQRVYGDTATPSTWAEHRAWYESAWDLRRAYDRAWEQFADGIIDVKLDYNDVEQMTAFFPLVISTIPQWSICKGNHIFESVPILISRRSLYEDDEDSDNFVVYNGGDEDRGWFRSSRIFGMESTETVARDRNLYLFQDGEKFESGYKIVGNNCDCHPNLVRTGRMGCWRRGVMTAHAYAAAVEAYTTCLAI